MIHFHLIDHRSTISQVRPLLQQLSDRVLALAINVHDATRFGFPVHPSEDIYHELLVLQKILQAKAHGSDCVDICFPDLMTLIKTYLNTTCAWDPDV